MVRLLRRSFWLVVWFVFVASVGMWVHSYWATDYVFWTSEVKRGALVLELVGSRGDCLLLKRESGGGSNEVSGLLHFSDEPTDSTPYAFFLTSDTHVGPLFLGRNEIHFGVELRYWIITLLFGLVLAGREGYCLLSKMRQRRRRMLCLCMNCGYDLRATPERCPECGTQPSKTGHR
jgi:hypothetical protein